MLLFDVRVCKRVSSLAWEWTALQVSARIIRSCQRVCNCGTWLVTTRVHVKHSILFVFMTVSEPLVFNLWRDLCVSPKLNNNRIQKYLNADGDLSDRRKAGWG